MSLNMRGQFSVLTLKFDFIVFEELLRARCAQQWWQKTLHLFDVALNLDFG